MSVWKKSCSIRRRFSVTAGFVACRSRVFVGISGSCARMEVPVTVGAVPEVVEVWGLLRFRMKISWEQKLWNFL